MHNVFSELSLVIAIGAGVALVMRIIKQPLIIGHILTGILVGPAVFHLIQSADTIEVFAKIGIALLLFIIGLGLNPLVIKEVGKVAGIIGVFQVALSTLLGWIAGVVLGLTNVESLFLGIALSFSSTIIILKLLSDKKEQSRLYGKITVGLLLVQDVIATLALLLVTAHNTNAKGFSGGQLLSLGAKGLLIGGIMIVIGTKVLPRMHTLIAGSQEFLFLFSIGWGFGSAALFEWAGFSIEIGALFAGVALASLPYTQEISSRLRPLRDFFVVVFFISLGTRLGFGNIHSIIPIIAVSSILVIVIKPALVLAMMGLFGYTKRTSFKSSIAMAQVSEFSLVFMILGKQQGLVREELVSAITFVALISIAVSAYLIIYADKLFVFMEKHLTMFERRKHHFEREHKTHFDLVLFGYQRGGHEFLKVFKQLHKKYIVIDYDPEVIDTLEHREIPYVYGDATDIELLDEAGIDKAKLVVSTITDHETNVFLVKLLESTNPTAVVICHSDTVEQAAELYGLGASYVMMPHYIGSEKISAFIRRSGLSKSEFKKFREKHLAYLQTHLTPEEQPV
jgi:Kef-type K+ transport system membrane component KefB